MGTMLFIEIENQEERFGVVDTMQELAGILLTEIILPQPIRMRILPKLILVVDVIQHIDL
jgi:hypothetical protein